MSIKKLKKEYSYKELLDYFVFKDNERGDKIMEFCHHYELLSHIYGMNIFSDYIQEYITRKYKFETTNNHFEETINSIIESYKICNSINKRLIKRRIKYIFRDYDSSSPSLNLYCLKTRCKFQLDFLKCIDKIEWTNDMLIEIVASYQKYIKFMVESLLNNNFDIKEIE